MVYVAVKFFNFIFALSIFLIFLIKFSDVVGDDIPDSESVGNEDSEEDNYDNEKVFIVDARDRKGNSISRSKKKSL